MPENPRKVDRIVRTQRGPGILYYQLETDGAQLITFDVNSSSNEVTPEHSSKARYGHDFVEADESRQVLDDKATATTDAQREAGITPVTDRPIFNESNLQQTDPADTNADGELSDKEKKRWNKSHPNDQR